MKYIIMFFRLIQGRSLESVGLSLIVFVLATVSFLLGVLPFFIYNLFLILFSLDVLYMARAFWWRKRYGKQVGIYGYLRWDKVLEIHIGPESSALAFQRRLRMTLRYACEHGYMLEFTSGMIPYGKLVQKYGNGIVSVSPLGLIGRTWHALLASTFLGDNPKYNVTHPLKVVLDPRLFLRQEK